MRRRLMILAAMLGVFAIAAPVSANPPGIDPGKLLFKFNVLATPKKNYPASDTTCTNSGRRIFFQRTTSGQVGTITWQFDPTATGFRITDCNGINDGTAVVKVDESIEGYVAIRILGKKTDSLDLTCTNVVVSDNAEDLCLIDTVHVNKSKDFTKIMTNLFDNAYEEVLWTLDTSTGFRNMDVRFYAFAN